MCWTAAAMIAAVLTLAAAPANAAPAFVQQKANEVGSGTNSAAFTKANTSGDTIVVYLVWSNTSAASLTDTRGNTYVAATARTTWGTSWSAQVFYAANIAAGANTVTASFGTPISSFAVMYLNEYSGLSKTSPVDVSKSATGTASAMSSGNVTTTNANDLLFSAGASSNTVNGGASGWNQRSTASGNRTQDLLVSAAGAYAGTAKQNGNLWVMQLVAFRADTGAVDTTPPSVPTNLQATVSSSTTVNLTWTGSTDNVAVAGYKIFRNGAQVGTSSTTSYQDTGLTSSTTYTYAVAAYDAAGNTSAQSTTANATTPDGTAPVVTMTAPATGATVSGTVTVTATATDNVGVAGVQFLLDGANLGAEDTASPYSVSWNTTTIADGGHTLSARARDAAGNTATATAVNVTVQNTAATGPVASYAFNEGTGTLTADASGHSLTGTLANGPTWVAGKHASAIGFDGADDRVDIGNAPSLQITGSMTVSAWVNEATFPADDAAIVSKRTSTGFQLDTTVDTGPRTIGFKLTNASGTDMIRYGATAMQSGTWYHVTGVYDAASQTMNVYLNGALDNGSTAGTITSTQLGSTANVMIGLRPDGGFGFNGAVDDVRIYNRALSATEVAADMNTPVGPASSDVTPPSVALTAPANNAQVSNIVTVSADADDDVGVAGVQFLVDGTPTGAEDTTAPYGLQWDTRGSSNGAHTLTATARDAAGNIRTSTPVTVNVANATSFHNDILATGMALPTAMKFMPDGDLLMTLLAGKIVVLPPPYTTPDPTPFLQLTNIGSNGVQQGIYDLQLDPSFTTNHFYYIFYTLGTPNRDRLSRLTANADFTGTVAGSEKVLYQDPEDANAEHHGGAINFGNDGKIYVTTGEHFNPAESQDLTKPRGKILRFNPDGTVPTDNPFYDGSGPNYDAVWALGLRNPYRAYYDSPTGRLFVGDVGGNDPANSIEELNLGARGANYGWANVEGPCPAPCTSPIYSYPHANRDAAITAGFVYHGTAFPSDYEGSFFFADYTQNWIKRVTLDATGHVTGVYNFEPPDGSADGPYGDIVYLTEGPDGSLYYLDLGYSDVGGTFGVSKLRRISFDTSNQAPIANASANVTSGPAPLSVNFSSAGSSDPEGQSLTYSWDFGDGTTSTAANPSHTYNVAGPYTVRLTVSDGVNSTISTPISIEVGSPPTPTITSPTDGTFFVANQVISYSGTGTDPQDGTLPASAFTWNIDFLHDGHVHPGTPVTGVKSGTFTIPTTGHDFEGLTRYRITLTVTDSSGLSTSTSVIIWPTKVNLTFNTAPQGVTLYLDGIAKTTPFVYDTLVGFNHDIEARNATSGNSTYTFASWSDGGAQEHVIVVPSTDKSYTANYSVTTATSPTFVQVNSATPQTTGISQVTVPYLQAQGAGDLNAIAVGWNDATSTILSVTDSAGNTYQLAAPTTRGTGLSQAIYYAKNITAAAAGSNSVTVKFASAVPWPDIRVVEYRGVDTVNPLDTTASANGAGASASSGNLTTAAANELVFGAGMTTGVYVGGTNGFTTRVITPQDADIVIDTIATTAGPYAATANVGASDWIMQAVAFRSG
jgi:glucose/arabinose dehydrogenase